VLRRTSCFLAGGCRAILHMCEEHGEDCPYVFALAKDIRNGILSAIPYKSKSKETPMKNSANPGFIAVTSLVAMFAGNVSATIIVDHPDFSNTADLSFQGSATTTSTGDGTVLRVTPASGGQSGAAYSTSPVTLGASDTFSTTFQFRFTNPGGWDPADGITFVLAASPTGLGSGGVGMGYQGVNNSVAVEFDTYNNTGYSLGNDDGNSSNHVSIDTNGALTNSAITNVYGNGSCGFPVGGTPNQNDYTVDGCMSNGHLWTAIISYDGSDLSVSLLDPAIGTAFDAISSYAIDLSSILGTSQAYVGFTAGTGAGWENHDIVNWQFADTTQLAGDGGTEAVPEPTSICLIGLGLAGLGFRKKAKGT